MSLKNPVKTLNAEVARKIAAGEVIDRPNAIIRELMDNAIDSGATAITVEITGGGIDCIRIIDNGCGMTKEDLQNCARPHATSKISTETDLMNLSTLGFRGEALASIAAVARLSIQSGGWKMKASVTEDHLLEPVAETAGTIVQSEGLFENFPARRVFLKRPATEGVMCKNTFIEKALARPDIAFRLVIDGQTKIDLPANQTQKERFINANNYFEAPELFYTVSGKSQQLTEGEPLWSFDVIIGEPSVNRSSKKEISIYVNGRKIQEYSLVQAIEYGGQGYFPNGTYPVAAAFIKVDPKSVDFNIHPAKKEARFYDISDLHHGLSSTIKHFFQQYTQQNFMANKNTDEVITEEMLSTEVPGTGTPLQVGAGDASTGSPLHGGAGGTSTGTPLQVGAGGASIGTPLHSGAGSASIGSPLQVGAGGTSTGSPLQVGAGGASIGTPLQVGAGGASIGSPLHSGAGSASAGSTQNNFSSPLYERHISYKTAQTQAAASGSTFSDFRSKYMAGNHLSSDFKKNSSAYSSSQNQTDNLVQQALFAQNYSDDEKPFEQALKEKESEVRFIGCCLGTFLLAEKNKCLYIIDQHAVHERILFDRLMNNQNNSGRQPLLIPYKINTESKSQDNQLEKLKDRLSKIGFTLTNPKEGYWEVTEVPDRWTGTEYDLRTLLFVKHVEPEEIIRSIAAMTACKAAIKDGYVIDEDTAEKLVKQAFTLKDPHCPHGRPVYTVISREQLFALVKRT